VRVPCSSLGSRTKEKKVNIIGYIIEYVKDYLRILYTSVPSIEKQEEARRQRINRKRYITKEEIDEKRERLSKYKF
jgi:hypothetical protein